MESGRYPRQIMGNPREALYVAVHNGAPVGLMHIIEEATPPFACFVQYKYATIVDLFVTEKFRGNGIGGKLLEAALQWSNSRMLDYIELNVLAENEDGARFYRKKGFKPVSHIMRLQP